jgi:hypothetical protein
MNAKLFSFVLTAMSWLAPKDNHEKLGAVITEVVDTEDALFKDDTDKLRTASLIIAIAYREGTLRLSTVGDCDESKPGQPCKGKPRSYCTMQIHESMGGGPALNEDPALCIRTGLRILRQSIAICPAWPIAGYASGPEGCDNERAQRISRDRTNLARWLWFRREKAFHL